MSSTENVRKFRERQKAKGLAEVRGIYLPKKYHVTVKEYANKIKGKHARN
jgi:hypothetical protein